MALSPSRDAAQMAKDLGVPVEAVMAVRQTELVDLHIDTFIPVRLWHYDINKRHRGLPGGHFGHHLDMPRIADAGLTSAMWSVTTNPLRTRAGRFRTARKNFARLRKLLDSADGQVRVVATHSDFLQARAEGLHAALLSIQGGNALDDAPEDDIRPDPDLLRVTLVHLTNSEVGESSQPLQIRHECGLTEHGRQMVERLNRQRIFVDLAHISKRGFWEALEVHDKTQPVLVTHTGVESLAPVWRNIDDAQIRAVADTGGTVGIMFHTPFLTVDGECSVATVIDHAAHVMEVVGEDFVSIGSDYDGAITPPSDLSSGDSYPRLVAEMLRRRWTETRIEKVLGSNFLRTFKALRP